MRPGQFRSELSSAAFVVGAVLFVLGTAGVAADLLPGAPISGGGLGMDVDLELVGLLVGAGAVVGDRATGSRPTVRQDDRHPVYVTRPLLDTLLDAAGERDPSPFSVGLAVTPAGDLVGDHDLPDAVPVFTHLYVPERPNAVSAVFGMDLQTPPRGRQGRFLTHPRSELRLTERDDLHEVVLVAVPPWDDSTVVAFDRRGRRHPLRVVDATPPDESLPRE